MKGKLGEMIKLRFISVFQIQIYDMPWIFLLLKSWGKITFFCVYDNVQATFECH